MIGRGGDKAFVPATREDEVRGYPVGSDGYYHGGRITNPRKFAEDHGVSKREVTPFMLDEHRKHRTTMPRVDDWWCGTCGAMANYANNEECWFCSHRRDDVGVRYVAEDFKSYRLMIESYESQLRDKKDVRARGGEDAAYAQVA